MIDVEKNNLKSILNQFNHAKIKQNKINQDQTDKIKTNQWRFNSLRTSIKYELDLNQTNQAKRNI